MPLSLGNQNAELSDDSASQTSDQPGQGAGRGCVGKKRGGASGKPQQKNKRKKRKKQGADAPKSDKANSLLNLMGKHAQLQQKVNVPTLNRCWSWQHWRPQDEKYGCDPIVRERFDELKNNRPRLQCIHCNKILAWSPSTTRKEHLLLNCKAFSATNEFKDPKVVADREDLLRKKGSQQHVRILASCRHLRRFFPLELHVFSNHRTENIYH
jgi:hypothetical protein